MKNNMKPAKAYGNTAVKRLPNETSPFASLRSAVIAGPMKPKKASAPAANGMAVPPAAVKIAAVVPIAWSAVTNSAPAMKNNMKAARAYGRTPVKRLPNCVDFHLLA